MPKRMYLDYAAATPLDPEVGAFMRSIEGSFGNPGSLHREGQDASRLVGVSRRVLAGMAGVPEAGVVFTGSATEANNLAIRGSVAVFRKLYPRVKPRIIVSVIEHASVLETARSLERSGVELVVLGVSRDGVVDLGALGRSLNARTALVSVMFASNEVGTVEPIGEVANLVNEFRAADLSSASVPPFPVFHTDAAQAAQYLQCDVESLGVDLMTLSSHKVYGPKGVGALIVRSGAGEAGFGLGKGSLVGQERSILEPLVTGGGQEWGLRAGTENVVGIAGFGKAIERTLEIRDREFRRVSALRDRLWRGIGRVFPKALLNGPTIGAARGRTARLPNNLNVFFGGVSAQEMLVRLDLLGVAASAGSACSARTAEPSYVVRALGYGEERARGSVRFTLGRMTTAQEIERAIGLMRKVSLGVVLGERKG